MLFREDFYSILRDTVNLYYCSVMDSEISFSYEFFDESEKLIVNAKLGFVSHFPSPRGLLTFLNNEYNIRGGLLKYAIGHIAALGIWALPFIGMTKYCFVKKGILNKNTFIYPQNRSIRFFNYNSGMVDCIVKSGFSDRYFNNQLDFRLKHTYDFILPLCEYGERWFREPILNGHPLARTRNKSLFEKSMNDALEAIKQLADDTRTYMNADKYSKRLLTYIEENIKTAIKRKKIKYGKEISKVAELATNTVSLGGIIPLCMGHGDLQSGNIWVDSSEKTYIYDWETAGIRSVWYDCSVLHYSLRRTYGWKQLLESSDLTPALICEDGKVKESFDVIINTVLLEDIIFYLDDMLELPEDWGTQIFDEFSKRISSLFGVMEVK